MCMALDATESSAAAIISQLWEEAEVEAASSHIQPSNDHSISARVRLARKETAYTTNPSNGQQAKHSGTNGLEKVDDVERPVQICRPGVQRLLTIPRLQPVARWRQNSIVCNKACRFERIPLPGPMSMSPLLNALPQSSVTPIA